MDELVRYGPMLLSSIALLLAWSASRRASRALPRDAHRLVSAPRPMPAPSPPPPAPVPVGPPRVTGLEERLGALEERLSKLSAAVAFAARPDPDDVAPMRPPTPTTVEPLAAPRAGWRMFP